MTYRTHGYCPYADRCRFIHESNGSPEEVLRVENLFDTPGVQGDVAAHAADAGRRDGS